MPILWLFSRETGFSSSELRNWFFFVPRDDIFSFQTYDFFKMNSLSTISRIPLLFQRNHYRQTISRSSFYGRAISQPRATPTRAHCRKNDGLALGTRKYLGDTDVEIVKRPTCAPRVYPTRTIVVVSHAARLLNISPLVDLVRSRLGSALLLFHEILGSRVYILRRGWVSPPVIRSPSEVPRGFQVG